MRDKLLLLMKNEGLTSSRLAELLGIQPSSISHILGGRNKPSFDFVQKILRRFPNINPDWLLIDKGDMYRSALTESASTEPMMQSGELLHNEAQLSTDTPINFSSESTAPTFTQPVSPNNIATQPQLPISRGRVKRVIVLYDDHTFESYEISR